MFVSITGNRCSEKQQEALERVPGRSDVTRSDDER